jgi:citrate lyase subunit beta / citryl-CoA lyase
MTTVVRTWLYVPGHRTERIPKALASAADAVIIDLEDAVPPAQKELARENAVKHAGHRVWIRVNSPASPWGEDDLAAVAGLPIDGLRVPRADDPDTVRHIAERTRQPLQLVLETATGLARAVELASAHPAVAGIGLGEADLAADLRVTGDAGLAWARGWVVVAARSAGLPSPVQSVYTDVADLDGLRASTARARAEGFLGRGVVHPKQIPIVHEVYTPDLQEVAAARAVVETAARAAEAGEVAVLDDQGRFIDPAVVAKARTVLDLAEGSQR